jgi:hypothetical protein
MILVVAKFYRKMAMCVFYKYKFKTSSIFCAIVLIILVDDFSLNISFKLERTLNLNMVIIGFLKIIPSF